MSTHDTALRVVPRIALGTHRSWRLVERNLTSSRDGWLVVVSGFFEPLAWVTPLWHGVELSRSFATGELDGPLIAVHVAYLVAFTAVGAAIAVRACETRLRR